MRGGSELSAQFFDIAPVTEHASAQAIRELAHDTEALEVRQRLVHRCRGEPCRLHECRRSHDRLALQRLVHLEGRWCRPAECRQPVAVLADQFQQRVRGGNALGGGNRSRWGWYAGQVQKTVAEALRQNPRLRKAAMSAQVRVWADSNGRVTRVTLAKSTGDPALDEAITSEALRGLQLAEAPPRGMPMPINLKLTARRPN